jgi:altronate hydrolase
MPTGDLSHKRSARALRIAAGDDVAVAVDDLVAGETVCVDGSDIMLREAIARGHKFALRDLAADAVVHKYGFPIGRTTAAVARGAWLHTHNLATQLSGVGVSAEDVVSRALR